MSRIAPGYTRDMHSQRRATALSDGTGPAGPMWAGVLQQIVDRIVTARYAENSLLPNETLLGEEFGVSRSVVREATKVLVEKGLAAVERGNGIRVAPKRSWRSLDAVVLAARLRGPDSAVVLRELFVLRKAVEPELAALAAEKSDTASFIRLSACVQQLVDALGDEERYLAADLAFHEAIVQASGVELAQDFFDAISDPLLVSRSLTGQLEGAIENAHGYHLALFEHIRHREADAARAAMRDHLQWAEDHLERES